MNRRRFFAALAVLPMVPAVASAAGPDGVMTFVSGPLVDQSFQILGTITGPTSTYNFGDPRTYIGELGPELVDWPR